MVTVERQYVLCYEKTQRKWVVPSSCIHEDRWLQLRPTCYGLCSLLGAAGSIKNPSLRACKALSWLQAERNKLLHLMPSRDDLFDEDEQPSSAGKKRKAAHAHAHEEPEHVDVPLPDGHSLRVRACTKKSENVQVLLEPEALEMVFSYLTSVPFQFQTATRNYVRSGKFRKRKGNEPEDDEDAEQDEED